MISLLAAACAMTLAADSDAVIIVDTDVSSAAQSPAFVAAPHLQLGLASRVSGNLSQNELQWWTLARARMTLAVTDSLDAVFEGWVRWGPTTDFHLHDAYWQSDVQMREAYVSWTWEKATLRVGQRLFVWGKNEWSAPADVLNPYDARYDLFAAVNAPKDMRVPVWAADATYHAQWGDIEAVLAPFFTPHKVFLTGHDISLTALGGPYVDALNQVLSGLSDGARDSIQQGIQGTDLPDLGPAGATVAVRASGTYAGWDMAATAYFGWDRVPWLQVDPDAQTLGTNANAIINNPQTLITDPNIAAAALAVRQKTLAGTPLAQVTYRRMAVLAFETETAVGPFVLRGDVGYTPGQTFYSQSFAPLFLHDVRAVVGADYARGETLFLSISLSAEAIFGPPKDALLLGLEVPKESMDRAAVWLTGAIVNVRWAVVEDAWELRALGLITPKPVNYLAGGFVAYTAWAPHNVAVGALWVGGQSGTLAGDFSHNRFAVLQYQGVF